MLEDICEDFRRSCTGCGACAAVCPSACIQLERDSEGFDYPSIDANTCISCGRCARTCPNNAPHSIPAAHFAWAFQEADRAALESSSGGAFHALALNMLARGGVVYGFAFEGTRVVMKRAVDEVGLKALRGSKYIQGTVGNAYHAIADDVAAGLLVLVCGVPCQITAVATMLTSRERKRVLLVDLACHGVPSPGMFEKHAKWLAAREGSPLVEVSFRDKRHAHWLVSKHFRYRFGNGKVLHGNWKIDPFYNAYLKGIAMRECCYRCRYATLDRTSDITLADFWGFCQTSEGVRLRDGVSAVIAHTERGMHASEALSSRGVLIKADAVDVMMGNPNFAHPTQRPAARDTAYRDIASKGYDAWAHGQVTPKDRITGWLADEVPAPIVATLVALRSHLKGNK